MARRSEEIVRGRWQGHSTPDSEAETGQGVLWETDDRNCRLNVEPKKSPRSESGTPLSTNGPVQIEYNRQGHPRPWRRVYYTAARVYGGIQEEEKGKRERRDEQHRRACISNPRASEKKSTRESRKKNKSRYQRYHDRKNKTTILPAPSCHRSSSTYNTWIDLDIIFKSSVPSI
jgi:hypothetical protein